MRKRIEKVAIRVLFISGAMAQVTLSLQPTEDPSESINHLKPAAYQGDSAAQTVSTVVGSSQALLEEMYYTDLEGIGSSTPGREEGLLEVEKNLSSILDKTDYDYEADVETRMKTIESIILQISMLQWKGIESFSFHENHVTNDNGVYAAHVLPSFSTKSGGVENAWSEYADTTKAVWSWAHNDSGQIVLSTASLSEIGSNAISAAATSLLRA